MQHKLSVNHGFGRPGDFTRVIISFVTSPFMEIDILSSQMENIEPLYKKMVFRMHHYFTVVKAAFSQIKWAIVLMTYFSSLVY